MDGERVWDFQMRGLRLRATILRGLCVLMRSDVTRWLRAQDAYNTTTTNSHSEERFSSRCQQFLDEAEKRMLGFGLFLALSSPTFSQALLGSFCQVVPILFVVMVAFPPATTIYPI